MSYGSKRRKVLAICGSTRKESSNLSLINAIKELAANKFDVTLFNGLTQIPHFNPDIHDSVVLAPVASFRDQLQESDGVLICTPEYAMGVPGTLKNAIDWTVSTMVFSKKPTALITASSSGQKAHASLIETLKVIEADIKPDTQLLIPHVKTKVNAHGKITDAETLTEVVALINALADSINKGNEFTQGI